MTAVSQPSFTTGEMAPSLYGRVDLARFYTALRTCRNFIVRPFGGVCNRPGTRFVCEVADSSKLSRLIPFEFSASQSYALELSDMMARVIKSGGLVLWPSGPDTGEPVEITTIWPSSELDLLKFTQSADVMTLCHNAYPPQQLSRTDHHLWSLAAFHNTEGPFQEINIDTSKTVRASNMTGSVTLTASSSLFTSDMVGQMLYLEQAPDAVTRKWQVSKEIQINDIRRAGSSYYQAVELTDDPSFVLGTVTGTVQPDHLEGAAYDGDPGIAWLYLHSGFGIVLLTGFTSDTVMTGTVLSRLPDSVVSGAISKNITGVIVGVPMIPGGEGSPDVPATDARVTCPAHGFSDGDSVTIAGVVGVDGINTTAQIIVIDANTFDFSGVIGTGGYVSGGAASKSINGVNTYKWALGAWGGNQGYPAATIYYQQRQVFGASTRQPQTSWMSRSAGFTDFGQSVPLLDDDSISFKLVAEKMGEIRHFIRMKSLIALTSEGAWMIQKEQGNPIPSTDPQEQGGSSHVRPLKVGKSAVYVEDKGGAIRSLGYEFNSDSYEGRDLATTGSHLVFGKTVVDWAYQKVPFRCIWIVLDDGSLIGLTYLPDQEVVGWHRHDTDGFFESVCCIPEGNEDAVYFVVRRTIGGIQKRYIERLAPRFPTDDKDYFFVDSGLTYDGRQAGAGVVFTLSGGVEWSYQETLTFTTTTDFFSGISDVGDSIILHDITGEAVRLKILQYVSSKVVKVLAHRTVPAEFRNTPSTGFQVGRDTFTGLGHLEGKTVSILADGNEEAQAVVSGGAIVLSYPASVVHVGLPIEADFETLDINVQGQSIQDKVKNVRSVKLVVEKTRGLQAGPDANNLLEISPTMSGQYDQPIKTETGIMEANIISDWSDGGRVLVRQSSPLPVTILAAIPEVAIGGA